MACHSFSHIHILSFIRHYLLPNCAHIHCMLNVYEDSASVNDRWNFFFSTMAYLFFVHTFILDAILSDYNSAAFCIAATES